MKTLIVGGGIAGLAIAWTLCRKGVTVEIVERGICGRAASWAAAGMIAPGGELAGHGDAIGRFGQRAREAWPEFASGVEHASGIAIEYLETGSLFIALTEPQAERLRRNVSGAARWLSREQILGREPSMSPDILGGVDLPDDARVDNRALCESLRAGLIRTGVAIHENCEVRSVVATKGKATAVVTADGTMEADNIVLACGAWLNLITANDIDLPAVRPVKGQMLSLAPPPGGRLPAALIWSDDVYLVSRRGRLLVGATVENAGFDTSVERDAHQHLVRSAARLMPNLLHWRLAEIWAGLRPRAGDDAPVLGKTAIEGLYVASGQFRNGILFAPVVGDLLSTLICGGDGGEFSAAFSPRRFAA